MIRSLSAVAALGCVLAFGLPAQARDNDGGAWLSVTAATPLSRRVDATMEAHTRFTEDAGGLWQLLLRPSVTLKLDDRFTLTAGYAYVRTDPPGGGAVTHEHRVWEQVGYTFVRNDRLILSGRTRIEQRFFEGRPDTGWRLRQQLRAAVPLKPRGKVQLLTWNETFVGFNDTVWGQRATIDQTRTFVGLALPLARNTTIEPGYLNHAVIRRGPDLMNHLFAVNVFTRF